MFVRLAFFHSFFTLMALSEFEVWTDEITWDCISYGASWYAIFSEVPVCLYLGSSSKSGNATFLLLGFQWRIVEDLSSQDCSCRYNAAWPWTFRRSPIHVTILFSTRGDTKNFTFIEQSLNGDGKYLSRMVH